MKTVLAYYLVDAWHSHSSKNLVTIATSKTTGIKLVKEYVKKHRIKPLSNEDLEDLDRHHQTSGRNDNFLVEEITLNELN